MLAKILAGALALSVIALGVGGYFLRESWQENARLENANKSLTESLAAKERATQGRAQTQQRVRTMAPAEKLERLK